MRSPKTGHLLPSGNTAFVRRERCKTLGRRAVLGASTANAKQKKPRKGNSSWGILSDLGREAGF